MPIVTDYKAVKEIYQDAAERRIGLPVFCAEDRETLEAILAAGLRIAQSVGREDIPIIPAWTCRGIRSFPKKIHVFLCINWTPADGRSGLRSQ